MERRDSVVTQRTTKGVYCLSPYLILAIGPRTYPSRQQLHFVHLEGGNRTDKVRHRERGPNHPSDSTVGKRHLCWVKGSISSSLWDVYQKSGLDVGLNRCTGLRPGTLYSPSTTPRTFSETRKDFTLSTTLPRKRRGEEVTQTCECTTPLIRSLTSSTKNSSHLCATV